MKKLIFVITWLLFAIPCQARIITVDDDGLADFNNIQAAINDANDGDTVVVDKGTFNENIHFGGKNITLISTDPNDPNIVKDTVIRGDGTNSVVKFLGSEDASCRLSGFTITGGGGSHGSGINGYQTTAEITNCIITGNLASDMSMGSLIGSGGGLYKCHGSIRNCTISGNKARLVGGGLDDCDGSITNCTITGNIAIGVYPITLAWGLGGGLFGCNGPITNCTISGNLALTTGGIFNDDAFGEGETFLLNCIIWDNIDESGTNESSQVYRHGMYDIKIINYCCIQGWTGALGGTGNIGDDPLFAEAGYLDPNGTPDFPEDDFWIDGDYHLKSQAGRWEPNSESWVLDDVTSPCIDAGNPGCPEANEPAPNGNRRNMGAYGGTAEASKSPPNWRSIADMTNDWVVDSNDLRVYVDYWLESGECIPSDFDRSLFVDFNDFAIFGLQWSYPSASEPSMTFQIDDCNMEEGQSWPAVAESNEPRFSVWVEGRYIHFVDMMIANCCPDELGLDKEINGNEITLYEIGYGGLCDCMCYFPITATLGPFEDGTYTVEVFDNYGNSLGVVEVTIGGSPEPGITYQIEDCNQEASVSFTAEPPDKRRFTITVEGPYIHFEDTMVANCCPDELGLEMTVEDNLITIYETEYTPGGCYCICDYPVTATLGPFETGVYTLEVYEDWGGFIGNTTVVIDPPE